MAAITSPVARKPWECMMCGGEIPPGQRYTRIRAWGRPEIVTHRTEAQCRQLDEENQEGASNGRQ